MNSRRGAPRSARRARWLVAASVVGACAAFLAIPGGASAASVTCSGKLTLNKNGPAGPRGVNWNTTCNEDIQSLSLTVDKKIDYFTPDPVIFAPNGTPAQDGSRLDCEGDIPGWGFGCPGYVTAGNKVKGSFATIQPPCNPPVAPGS